MIRFATGNILANDAEALVNTVNCVGVMGRGIALQFKKAYPQNFQAYAQACERGEVQPGRMFVYETGALDRSPGSEPPWMWEDHHIRLLSWRTPKEAYCPLIGEAGPGCSGFASAR